MRLFPLLIIGVFIGTISCAQTNVPTVVKDAFSNNFPDAQSVEWEAEDGEYEAEFVLDGKKMQASFNASGAWLETETAIKKSALPAVVQQAIANGFAGFSIQEVEQLSTPEWSNAYEVELKKGKETVEVVFSDTGKVLHKETEDDDGEEEE